MKENNLAFEICKDFKRLSIMILVGWLLTIAGFLYYLSSYDFGNTTTQDVNDIANSSINQSVE